MTLIAFLLQGVALGLTAGASPGPLQTYLINETLSGGWRRSLPLIFVPILSDMPILILTTFIIRRMPEVFLQSIRIVGGLFVLYMAWSLWQRWRAIGYENGAIHQTTQRNFGRVVVMNLLNPNPYIFWTFVSGPILAEAAGQSGWHAFAFLLGFYGVFMGTMIVLITIFHQTRRLGPRVIHSIQLVSILILVIFGGILIKEGFFG